MPVVELSGVLQIKEIMWINSWSEKLLKIYLGMGLSEKEILKFVVKLWNTLTAEQSIFSHELWEARDSFSAGRGLAVRVTKVIIFF